jgi:hypothetical protein
MTQATERFQSFAAFYPYYLAEHRNPTCRRLHYLGTTMMLMLLVGAILAGRPLLLWFLPLLGYGPAWVGHFSFEHNRPATFKYPFYSFAGDLRMYWDFLTGRIRF